MFLYKHPNGIWYIHFDDPSGRKLKRSTKCKNKGDALRFLSTWEHKEKEKHETLQNIHLSQFRDQYMEHIKHKFVRKSISNIAKAFADLIDALNDPVMQKVRVLDVAGFIDKRQQSNGIWSARHYYAQLASAFETAVNWDILTVNPFRRVKKPEPPRQLPPFFSHQEFQQYLSVIDRQIFRDISVFAVLTCLRLNELIHLEWDDVDIDKRLIHIRNKDTFRTKTRKNRTIPMHEGVAEILTRLPRTHVRIFVDGDLVLTDFYTTIQVKKYIRKSGVNPKLHFHSFRHTGSSWMAQTGVSIFTISKILGHSSVQTTMIYAHFVPDQNHNAINTINIE